MKHKKEPSQPVDTTGPKGKESFKPHGSGDNKAGQAPRQDGKGVTKGTESHDGLWKHEHSVTQGPIQA